MSGSSTCKSCQRPIVWAKWRSSGKNVCLDPDPTARGNVELKSVGTENGRVVFEATIVRKSDPQPDKLYRVHFSSCPNADLHRRPRS